VSAQSAQASPTRARGSAAAIEARNARNERVVALVLDEGATLAHAAREVGVTGECVRLIIASQLKAEAAELAALTVDEQALRLRYARALELVGALPRPERWELLAAVVFPSPALADASLACAGTFDPGEPLRTRRHCRRCGVAYDGAASEGCPTCAAREAAA
jgi:transposase-like protein